MKSRAVWLVLGVLALGAGGQTLPPAVNRTVDFAKDVHAILAENCANCHAGGKRKGALSLESRDSLLRGGDSGPAAVEGKSAESLMIQLVSGMDADRVMPPQGRRLTEQEIGVLRAWIDQGLKWDLSAAPQEHVTPLKLQPVAAPEVPGETSTNLIDRFMAAYVQKRGGTEPGAVEDAQFARRVFYDVTGLPPTVEQLRAFLEDNSADKRAKLVDAVLADRQGYAEHWMTFWNDVLRNDFEGTGYIDGGRKQITDWLYNSLYENKPYDQFVRELIAPTSGSEGFIKGIVWRGDNAAVQTPPMQAARNLAQAFNGVNMKCASCHDSFTDHWQLAETYALANCFSDTPMELIRCDVALGKQAGYGFLWPELGAVDGTLPREQRMARIAELMTLPDNGFFSRTIVNRLWALYFGRGLVEPLDTIEGKAWYPELLETLAQDFIDAKYDLKHTMRLMMTSRAYQWPSVRVGELREKEFVFGGPEVRRLTAEQFYDTLSVLTGAWHINSKFTLPGDRTPEYAQQQKKLDEQAKIGLSALTAAGQDLPLENYLRVVRAWRVPSDTLMTAMGRPNREQVTTRRETAATTLQALELSNGNTLAAHLRRGAGAILLKQPASAAGLVNELYLHAAQRYPTAGELEAAVALVGEPVTQAGVEDFLWALAMMPDVQLIF